MREIRGLQAAADAATVVAPAKNWSPGMGASFVLGATVFLIAAGLAGYHFWQSSRVDEGYIRKPSIADANISPPPRPWEWLPEGFFQIDVDELSLQETIDSVWTPLSEMQELPDRSFTPGYIAYRNYRDNHWKFGTWAAGVATVGLALIGIPILLSGKK